MKSNWQIKKLGEVCEYFNGKAHEQYIDGKGKYIVINSKFISSNGRVFKRTNNALFLLSQGDIVMVLSDVPNGKALAKCYLIEKDNTYSLNQRICVIRSNKFYTKFLYYQLNRNKHFLSFDNGENQTNLRLNQILSCPFIVPSISMQKKIADKLDEVFEKAAKAKNNAENNLQNVRELFESYSQSVFANPGEGWEKKKLGEIIKLEYGKPLPDSKRKSDGVYPVYGANGEKDRSNEYYYDKYSIIVGRKGSAGEINLTEERFWPLDVTYFVTFDLKKHDLNFIYYILNNLKLSKLAKGVKPGINRNEVYSIDVHIPLLSEQKSIVAKLDALSTETKKLVAIYQQKLNDLEEFKKSILQKAFKGELIRVQL